MKNVTAIVVTYNRLSLLKRCLNALTHQQEIRINHLVVINNHSTDQTADYLKQFDFKNKIIKNVDRNLGGAGGFNYGLKVAMNETTDDYFWMMDDDTIVHDNTLRSFFSASNKLQNEFSFLSANVENPNNIPANVPVPGGNWTKRLNDGLITVENASFVSIFISRMAVEKVGYPISDFLIWHDDTEYTIRLNSYKPGYFVSEAQVTHLAVVGKTKITATNDTVARIPRYYYLFRNEVYIMRKHFGKRKVTKAVLFGYMVAIQCLVRAHDNRLKRFWSVFRGTTAGLFFNPKVEMYK